MSKFIKLTYADNSDTYVNVSHILTFEVSTDCPGYTSVTLGVGTCQVKETTEQILNRISRADTY